MLVLKLFFSKRRKFGANVTCLQYGDCVTGLISNIIEDLPSGYKSFLSKGNIYCGTGV